MLPCKTPCYCDNCYYDIDECQVVEVKATEAPVVEEFPTRKCPGAIFDCGVSLYDDEVLCDSCLEKEAEFTERNEFMMDQALAEWENRQVLNEEEQWLRWEESAEVEPTETADAEDDDWF